MDHPMPRLEPMPDRWTVIFLNSRGKEIGLWLGVKGATPQEAIKHVFWHNLPKERRLYVCEGIAYRQDEAAIQHMKPIVDLIVEDFPEAATDEAPF